ncbi:MAG: GNAT family N-acetyltransferase [Candidatus Omnitrophica bacterium]|nr:GNAT family N-acetyltransferase [Patescibacteria group bacterium]MBU4304499.1 GNAT family N-acetyltransferase [Candidatus Omnitrophota bacterium]MBU4479791.1 GNAT family N-acetyltransferase [Candidatus Omnitrophota bacterium]
MNKKSPLKTPVLLEKYHVLDTFDCGVESLNTYLRQFAHLNIQNNSSRTYVTVRGNSVVGYYAIAPGSVKKEEAPIRVGKGLARHPIPVIILARLAVDKTEQKTGLGKGLLKDALIRIVKAADIIGGRAILVHAKDDKSASFYKKFGFEQSLIDRFHLYLLLKDIKKTLGI